MPYIKFVQKFNFTLFQGSIMLPFGYNNRLFGYFFNGMAAELCVEKITTI